MPLEQKLDLYIETAGYDELEHLKNTIETKKKELDQLGFGKESKKPVFSQIRKNERKSFNQVNPERKSLVNKSRQSKSIERGKVKSRLSSKNDKESKDSLGNRNGSDPESHVNKVKYKPLNKVNMGISAQKIMDKLND